MGEVTGGHIIVVVVVVVVKPLGYTVFRSTRLHRLLTKVATFRTIAFNEVVRLLYTCKVTPITAQCKLIDKL